MRRGTVLLRLSRLRFETLDNAIVKSTVCCGHHNANGHQWPVGVSDVANGREVTLSVVDQSERCLRAVNETQQRPNLLGIAVPRTVAALAQLRCRPIDMSR